MNRIYFLFFLALLATETLIALFLKSGFIRHTFGDFLVVILLYCFIKSFWNLKPVVVGIKVLTIAFTIEFLQLTPFLKWLHLEDHSVAKIILGSTFQVGDLIAYTLGILFVLIIEFKYNKP
ncbi:MAG TPA: DUF2809 domain-containing protein [Flavobacteriaceae bacterium]|nr:DUF2809 domain-containing protein [Flavobacteriaceae bacterium]